MRIDVLLLGAILGAFIFVPAGYIVRVWLSRATESVTRSPCVDEIYNSLDTHMQAINGQGTRLGQMVETIQHVESKLQLMSTEMADFFDKTRKSEERQRGLTRRAEAAVGDDEETAESDQRLLELMEQRVEEGSEPVGAALDSREAYYAAERRRLGM